MPKNEPINKNSTLRPANRQVEIIIFFKNIHDFIKYLEITKMFIKARIYHFLLYYDIISVNDNT